jgi:DNA-binding IclR family transcriptional regulator
MIAAPVRDSDGAVIVSVSAAVMADRDRGGASKMRHAASSAGREFPEIGLVT